MFFFSTITVAGTIKASGSITVNGLNVSGPMNFASNVGIGTTTPASLLEIASSSSAIPAAITFDKGGTNYFTAGVDTTGSYKIVTGNDMTANAKMTILQSGNIGFGTILPSGLAEFSRNQNNSTDVQITNATSGTGAAAYLLAGMGSGTSRNFEFSYYTPLHAKTNYADAGVLRSQGGVAGGIVLTTGAFAPIRFFTNEVQRAILSSGGNFGIGVAAPAEKLDVAGNVKVSGKISAKEFIAEKFATDTLSVSRITSTDSIIAFGDSTIFLNTVFHRVYVSDAANAGITLGNARINATGFGALAQSLTQSALGKYSTAIGYNVRTSPAANASIVLGSGLQSGAFTGTASGYLENTIPNSLMVGFNTSGSTPTLFVGPGNGTANATGNVGIGTSNPVHKLDVRGHLGVIDHLIFNSTSTHGVINWPATRNLYFRTNATPGDINSYTTRMILTGTGNLGIGNEFPAQRLDIAHEDGAGISAGIALRNLSAANKNSEIKFFQGNTALWAIGCDVNHNGGQNFFIYDNATNAPYGATRFYIDEAGRVGIGTIPPASGTYKLYVEGNIAARDVKVTALNFPDYVFADDYKLMSLYELENFLKKNKHLPGIPSAKEIIKNEGFEVGEMQQKLLEKIEEMSLYIIALQKQVDELKQEVANDKK